VASRGLRAVSLSGWIVITGLLLCDFRGTVGCSHEFGVVRLGVERIRSRYARGTELLQPISDLSDTLDQTTAAGSPRQPHPLLLDGPLLLYCIVIPHHPHPQSSQSHKVFPPPCALLRARYCCASPLVILNLRHLPSPQISLCSQRLVGCSLQTRKFRIRYPGSGAQTPP